MKNKTLFIRISLVAYFLLNFLSEFYFHEKGITPSFNLIWVFSVLFCIMLMVRWSIMRQKRQTFLNNLFRINGKNEIFFLLFILWCCFTLPLSIFACDSLKRISSFILIFFLFNKFILIEIDDTQDMLKVFKSTYFFVAVLVALAIAVLFINPSRYFYGGVFFNPYVSSGRTGSFFGPASLLGSFSLVLFMLSFLFIANEKRNFFIKFLFIFLGLIGVVISGSRSSLLACVLVFMLNFIFSLRTRRGMWIWFLVLIFIFLSTILFHFDPLKLFLRGADDKLGGITAYRFEIWQNLISYVMAKSPLVGFGIGNSEKIIPELGFLNVGRAHSSFIDVLVGSGIIGCALFSFFIFSILQKIYFLFKSGRDRFFYGQILIIAVALTMHSFFEQTLDSPAIFTFHLFMLCAISTKIKT